MDHAFINLLTTRLRSHVNRMRGEVMYELALVFPSFEDYWPEKFVIPDRHVEAVKQTMSMLEPRSFQRTRQAKHYINHFDGQGAHQLELKLESVNYFADVQFKQELIDEAWRDNDFPEKYVVIDTLQTWTDAMRPWLEMHVALKHVSLYADEPEQLTYYMPWVPRVLEHFLASNHSDLQQFAKSFNDPKSALKLLKRVMSGKMPTGFLSFAPEDKRYMVKCGTALTQYDLLMADKPTYSVTSGVEARVTLSKCVFDKRLPSERIRDQTQA